MKTIIYLSLILACVSANADVYDELLEKIERVEQNQDHERFKEAEKRRLDRLCNGVDAELRHWKACPDAKGMTPEGREKMQMLCFKNYTAAWDEAKDNCGNQPPYNPPSNR